MGFTACIGSTRTILTAKGTRSTPMAKADRFIKENLDVRMAHVDRLETIRDSMGVSKKAVLDSALDVGLAVLENPSLMVALLSSGLTLTRRD